jgi:putative ABC transport system permease protein
MSRPPLLVALALRLVRIASLLVPTRDRHAWRREWEAEIVHRQVTLDRERRSSLAEQAVIGRRALGSLADAAWLRRQFTRDSDLVHDVRHALRYFRSRPGYFAFAAAILAIGIGGTTAAFSLMDKLVLRALPYPEPARLVSLWQRNSATGDQREEVAPGNFADWRARATTFEAIAAAEPWSVDYIDGHRPEPLFATRVTERFFDLLGVRPLHGRLFVDDDHRPDAPAVAIISHAFWQRLGGDPAVVSRPVVLDAAPVTVIGVLPKDAELNLFDNRGERDVFLPKVLIERERQNRDSNYWAAIGRLRPGVTRGQAQDELDRISAQLAVEQPRTNASTTAGVGPLETHLMRTVRPALSVMIGAVVLVLLIACANVANLTLVRGAERQREFALRGALGASRARLVRQLLTENAVVALAGTALAIGVAWAALRAMIRFAPIQERRLDTITLDWSMLAIAIGVGAVTAIVFGLAPALQFSYRRPLSSGHDRADIGTRRSRVFRDSLVVTEVAIAAVLAVVVGLLLRSFTELLETNPGFRPERAAVVQVFAWDRHNTPEKLVAFHDTILERLRRLPGVREAGSVSAMPFIDANINIESPFAIDGRAPAPRGQEPTTHVTVATPGYFSVMNIPVIAGRGLTTDDHQRATPVAVITRTLASKYWPAGDAVGSRISFRFSGRVRTLEIVGVVGEVRHDALELPPRDELFMPYAQVPFGSISFVFESDADPRRLIQPAMATVWDVDSQQTIYDSGTVEQLIAASVAPRRFALVLSAVFGSLALLLAAMGIYAVMTVSTRQRTREIGVRLALGASSGEIARLVLARGLVLGAIGLAAGLAGALITTPLLQRHLFAVTPGDPLTLVAVALIVVVMTMIACYVPARRAMRVDPLMALREG